MSLVRQKFEIVFTAIVALYTPQITLGAFPVYASPGFLSSTGGYKAPYNTPTASSSAFNNGSITVTLASYSSGGNRSGTRAVRFSPNGWNELPLGAWPTGAPTDSSASAVSPIGTIAGTVAVQKNDGSFDLKTVKWEDNGSRLVELGTAGAAYPDPVPLVKGISANGVVVGEFSSHSTANRAVRWSAAGDPVELDSISPGVPLANTSALAVNCIGTAVGYSQKFDGTFNLRERAVRWPAGGTAVEILDDLGKFNNYTETFALAINDQGTAVGRSPMYKLNPSTNTIFSLGDRAVRWDANGTTVVNLGVLSTSSNGIGSSEASLVNPSGLIVGKSTKYLPGGGSLGSRAVRWNLDSTTPTELQHTLGTKLDGSFSTTASAMNADGSIVGYADKYNPANHALLGPVAALWTPTNVEINLNTLLPASTGWLSLDRATAISDTGWITGLGTFDPDGLPSGELPYSRYFLMLVPAAGTYGRGDANFDTKTDFDDLVILAQHYNESNALQNTNVADFDLNGTVDFNDLVVLAQNYSPGGSNLAGAGGGEGFAADWALAQSLVPEPSAVIVIVSLACIRRRRS